MPWARQRRLFSGKPDNVSFLQQPALADLHARLEIFEAAKGQSKDPTDQLQIIVATPRATKTSIMPSINFHPSRHFA